MVVVPWFPAAEHVGVVLPRHDFIIQPVTLPRSYFLFPFLTKTHISIRCFAGLRTAARARSFVHLRGSAHEDFTRARLLSGHGKRFARRAVVCHDGRAGRYGRCAKYCIHAKRPLRRSAHRVSQLHSQQFTCLYQDPAAVHTSFSLNRW